MASALTEKMKITKVLDYTSANTGTTNTASVDMAGYESVVFLTSFGTAAADNLMHVEQSSDDASSDAYADLEGSEVNAGGASDEDQWIEIIRPREQYVRAAVVRGTSSTIEAVWAIQYAAKSRPVDNTTTGTIAGHSLVSPAEGTK